MLKFKSSTTNNLNKLQNVASLRANKTTKRSPSQTTTQTTKTTRKHEMANTNAKQRQLTISSSASAATANNNNNTMSCKLNATQVANSMATTTTSKPQLAARVRSITGKLLESHGAELRRTLFSLRQIFQDDVELANSFVHDSSGGLEALLKVARDADQIQQNYILRAISQLIAQPNGMHCLARHNETLQWLYSLLTSQHRLVVRTSLKLLLLFVDAHPRNGTHLSAAIRQVDEAKGLKYWSHLIDVFTKIELNDNRKQEQANKEQDVDLLVDSMTLVNKTLDQIPQDQEETYFDLIDSLESLGMESIIKKYSNLDAQLREQFKIYEQKLASEDEEEEEEEEEASEQEHNMTQEQQLVNDNYKQQQQQHDERVKFSPNLISSMRKESNSGGGVEKREVRFNQFTQQVEAPNRYNQQQANKNTSESGKLVATTSRKFHAPITRCDDELDEEEIANDDNDYESANDDDDDDDVAKFDGGTRREAVNTDDETRNMTRGSSAHAGSSSSSSSSGSQLIVNNKLVQTVNENHQQANGSNNNRRHQLQLRSQPAPQYQRNSKPSSQGNHLARGKQQRASISSCSSSDSYASYGSGYASGSGNSTDHEQKQQQRQQAKALGEVVSSESGNKKQADAGDAINSLTTDIIKLKISSNDLEAVGAQNNKDDDDDDEDSQLKQHLSELEQLTDELAKRSTSIVSNNLNGGATSSKSNSKSSSVISTTSSNISSLSSLSNCNVDKTATTLKATTTTTTTTGAKQQVNKSVNHQFGQSQAQTTPTPPTSNNGGNGNGNGTGEFAADSRSTSSTPTLCSMQSKPLATIQTAAASYHARRQQQQQLDCNISGGGGDVSKKPDRPTHQYAMSSSNTTTNSPIRNGQQQQQQSINTANKQDSYYHNLFQWEQLVSKGVTRPLLINDLDFTDLRDEDDCDLLSAGSSTAPRLTSGRGEPLTISIPAQKASADHDSVDSGASTGGSPRSVNCDTTGAPAHAAPPPMPPPPISPWFNTITSGSRPQSQLMLSSPSPPPPPTDLYSGSGSSQIRDQSPAYSNYSSRNGSVCPPAGGVQSAALRSASSMSSLLFGNKFHNQPNGVGGGGFNKRKKTMKLFWKEVREDRSLLARLTKKKTIWDEIKPVQVDTSKLEYLFESKAKDLSLSKSRNGLDGTSQRKVKITVLDAKRSNAINIGMTKLPPMRTIKSAILKMDSSIMNREGIEKILTTMMPSEEEKSRIIEAQLANPDTPLGTAEQFLLNLASISALEARLKLWAFQLDYASIEKEVAEPLMDLKQAIDEIERSELFRNILATLLSIGNFLNSTNAKGFQIDYLEKVPEVKDTVHKHSLLHHLCLFIQQKFDPELASDLYSEFSAVNRASKVDYTEVAKSLKKMQQDCKSSWDYLKIVAKHDGLANLMNTCGGISSQSTSSSSPLSSQEANSSASKLSSSGKLNNLSKLSMITTVISGSSSSNESGNSLSNTNGNNSMGDTQPSNKQLKIKVSDFLTDCAERIMVLMVIHRRVMNRFQKLLVYLGCPLHQIKQTQPQQILKIINEFALEYRTKRERVREMLMRQQQCHHHHHHHHHSSRQNWQMQRHLRWAGSQQCIDSAGSYSGLTNGRPNSTVSMCATNSATNCPDCVRQNNQMAVGNHHQTNRPHSPSGLSQISNYSDFLLDQSSSSCCSRQESMTPVGLIGGRARPHSMSVSMLDLQHQQSSSSRSANNSFDSSTASHQHHHNSSLDENELARQKDEQLRRLLGAGKSLDEACHDLYEMSHWSSTMARVSNRHQPSTVHKQQQQRAASLAPWSHRNSDD